MARQSRRCTKPLTTPPAGTSRDSASSHLTQSGSPATSHTVQRSSNADVTLQSTNGRQGTRWKRTNIQRFTLSLGCVSQREKAVDCDCEAAAWLRPPRYIGVIVADPAQSLSALLPKIRRLQLIRSGSQVPLARLPIPTNLRHRREGRPLYRLRWHTLDPGPPDPRTGPRYAICLGWWKGSFM